jgi:hypothetical protein
MTAVEAQVVARVADDYRRRGYEVEVEPAANALPEFLHGFHPDLIARKPGDESVVVEVKVGTRTSAAEQLREIAERVNQQPGWRFSLVFADAERPDQITEAVPPPLEVVEERVRNAEALMRARQDEASFLLLWSALEGALRLAGERAQLPLASLPPSTLIRELYSAGEISREQFEALLGLLPVRNQLVHGFGSRPAIDVERLREIVSSLLADLRRS